MTAKLASFPGCLPIGFLDCVHDLWITWKSGRRPGTTRSWHNVGTVSVFRTMCHEPTAAVS